MKFYKFKLLVIICLVIFGCSHLMAQPKSKLKNAFDTLQIKGKNAGVQMLLEYQLQDGDKTAVINWNLANYYFAKSTEINPVIRFEDWLRCMKISELELVKFLNNIELEAPKSEEDRAKTIVNNKDFYTGTSTNPKTGKLVYTELITEATKMMESRNEIVIQMQTLVEIRNIAYRAYINAANLFRDITNMATEYNELLLNGNPEIEQKCILMTASYDSSQFYFKQFQIKYPQITLSTQVPKIVSKKIVHYKIDGLSIADFSKPEVVFWDYAYWANELMGIKSEKVSKQISQLTEIDKQLTQSTDVLIKTDNYSKTLKTFNIDTDVLLLVQSLDYNSVLSLYFKYKSLKISWLTYYRDPLNEVKDRNVSIYTKSTYYRNLFQQKLVLDSLSSLLYKENSPKTYEKYSSFFGNHFKNYEAFKFWIDTENSQNQAIIDNSLLQFSKFIYLDAIDIPNDSFVVYKNIRLNLKSKPIQNKITVYNEYVSTQYVRDNSGNLFLTGYLKPSSSKPAYAFLCMLDKNKTVKWFNTYNIKSKTNREYEEFGTLLQLIDGNCNLVITSLPTQRDMDPIFNTMMVIDSNGKELKSNTWNIASIPQSFFYNKLEDKYLLASKGSTFGYSDSIPDSTYISVLENDSLIYSNSFVLHGNVPDVHMKNEKIYCIVNYLKLISEKSISSYAGETLGSTNPAYYSIDNQQVMIHGFEYATPVFAHKIVPLSDGTFLVLVFHQLCTDLRLNFVQNSKLELILIDKLGKLIWKI